MEKKSTPLGTIIGGFVALIIGIIITTKTSSYTYYSYYPFSRSDSGRTLGIVIIIGALITIAVGAFRMSNQDEENDGFGPVEDFSERFAHEEKPAPAPVPVPVLTKTETPVAKKIVYCPYCGTAQKEDYMSCESCGAGRKK